MKKISLIIATAFLGFTFLSASAQDASDTNHVKIKTKTKVSADGAKKTKTTVKGAGTAGTVAAATNGTKPVVVNHPTTVIEHTPPPIVVQAPAPAPEPKPTTVTTTTTTNKVVPVSNPQVKTTKTTTTHAVHKTTTGTPVKKTTVTTTVKSGQ